MTGSSGSRGSSGSPGSPGGELVDVVDEHGAVVAQATRAEVRAGRLRHRCVFVLVLSLDGERLLVHQRADWKDVWPSRWDIAFGGVLLAGETFAAGAARELAEEVGVSGTPLELVGDGRYDDGAVSELAGVYRARSDGPFSFPDGEVVATEWVALDAIDEWRAGRLLCPDSVALALPLVGAAPPRSPAD
ncbi:MAG: NUDIX domain-containing protein [Actinobacteria bacterium]|nr:NUDIX domain-containing protein [Actinomycetota bacterium]